MTNIDLFGAFMVGLLGVGHCLGMCGGISSALATDFSHTAYKRFSFLVLYNIGRIGSYSLFGAIVGGLFASLSDMAQMIQKLMILKLFAGLLMVILGFHIAQWWHGGIIQLERLGKMPWKYLSPWIKKVVPVRNFSTAILFGAIWGWLPCGLVYTTLSWAAFSGNMISGALLMMCFGCGTLPAMLLVGSGSQFLQSVLHHPAIRQLFGLAFIVYGIYLLSEYFPLALVH